MSDASRNIPNVDAVMGPASQLFFPDAILKSGVTIYQGAAVYRDPGDSALLKASPSGHPTYEAFGVAVAKTVGDGVLRPAVTFGPHAFDNASGGDAIPATLPFGWPVYSKDNRTAALTNGGGLYPQKGWFGGFTTDATPKVIVWVGFCPFALRELLIPFAFGEADLTAAATSQAITLYTLPGPARVIHPPVLDSLTVFAGGSASAVGLTLGIDPTANALGTSKSIFTGGSAGAFTAGASGFAGCLLSAGGVLKATVTADVNVSALTAGACAGAIRLRPGS